MAAEARITKLSLRVPLASGAAARAATERRLQGVDWQPPGMPPSGILLIRRMGDPLPGTFDPAGRGFGAPRAWREAVRARLGTLFEGALRPGRGGAAESAEALYFPCLADLLAWLACALAERADGWWWQAARRSMSDHGGETRGLHPASRPAELLQALPRHLPATVAVLAQRGEVPVLLGAMDEAEAVALFRLLRDVFALPRHGADPVPASLPAGADLVPAIAGSLRIRPDDPPVAPWSADLAARGLAATGTPAQQALVGLALALHVRPLAVRTPGFIRQAGTWWRHVGDPHRTAAAPHPAGPAGIVRPSSSSTDETTARTKPGPDPADPIAAADRPAARPERPGRSIDPPTEAAAAPALAPDRSAPAARTQADLPSPAPFDDAVPNPTTSAESRAPVPGDPMEEAPARDTGPGPGERFVTRLGGLLYLIHCLDDLGIPADPALNWPVERAGAWGALHGVSRMLLADIGLDAEDDPIWDVFDALEPPLPAAPFVPADIRAPATWPRQLCDEAPSLRYAATATRLRLWSEAGYLLADVCRDGTAPAAQARREAARLPGQGRLRRGRIAPLPPDLKLTDPALAQAARVVTPAVRRRLCLALGCAPDDTRALRDLVHVTATLCLGASHIDMIARLDQIALPVRRAGLDRDPGWRPDLGRVILFHFR